MNEINEFAQVSSNLFGHGACFVGRCCGKTKAARLEKRGGLCGNPVQCFH